MTTSAADASAVAALSKIPVDQIVPSPHQARKDFDEEGIRGLAESMKQEGLVQPIVVRPKGDGRRAMGDTAEEEGVSPFAPRPSPFELISGERRLRAAKLLGWPTIEAKIIETASEAEAAAKGMVENLQRRDLNPIEEAEGFQTLNQMDRKQWTQERIAQIAGHDRSYIAQSLAILTLPEPIKKSVSRLTLSRSHALEILRLPTEKQQLEVADQIPGHLTREETRRLVDQMLGEGRQRKAGKVNEAAQFLIKEGFSFTARGQRVDIRAGWDRTTDLEDFLASLKGALILWSSTHPYENATLSVGPGGLPKIQKIQKVEDLVRQKAQAEAESGTPPPPPPSLEGIDPELIRLAQQGPKALYAKLYGPDHKLTQIVAQDTWADMGGTWEEGLKTLLKERTADDPERGEP